MSSLTSEFLTAFKILAAGQSGAEASEAPGGDDRVLVKLSDDDDGQVYQVSEALIKELRKLRRTPGISSPGRFAAVVGEKLAAFLPDAPPRPVSPKTSETDLFDLIRKGELDRLGSLVASGADLTITNDVGMTLLHEAARKGQPDMVAILLAHGADPNLAQIPHGSYGNDLSWTPLHYACNANSPDAVRRLLQAGAETDPLDLDQRRPLHLAAKSGTPELIQLLLDAGAELSAIDRNQKTALHYAAHFGHAEAFMLLIEKGIDVNTEDVYGHTALEETTPSLAANEKILDAVRQAGGNPQRTPQNPPEEE